MKFVILEDIMVQVFASQRIVEVDSRGRKCDANEGHVVMHATLTDYEMLFHKNRNKKRRPKAVFVRGGSNSGW